MEILKQNKNIVITILIILVLVGVGIFITRGGDEEAADAPDTESFLPDVEEIPRVDDSVEVTLEPDARNQEVILTVTQIPDGTDTIEYELSYSALVDGESVPKGVIGELDIEGDVATKQITLGTCSSGVCKYDQGVESIEVLLKFEGDYGAQLFEDSFDLE